VETRTSLENDEESVCCFAKRSVLCWQACGDVVSATWGEEEISSQNLKKEKPMARALQYLSYLFWQKRTFS
jgi:hypothetical protein